MYQSLSEILHTKSHNGITVGYTLASFAIDADSETEKSYAFFFFGEAFAFLL